MQVVLRRKAAERVLHHLLVDVRFEHLNSIEQRFDTVRRNTSLDQSACKSSFRRRSANVIRGHSENVPRRIHHVLEFE